MKIDTGTGDRGETGLLGGERVAKCDLRIEAYGDIDELSSVIGMLATLLPQNRKDLLGQIHRIQSELSHICAWLASNPASPLLARLKPTTAADAQVLEQAIDQMESELPELKHFVLPGGHPSAAYAHVVRTVCRRGERRVVQLAKEQSTEQGITWLSGIIAYLNRLSDYFFVLSRYCNLLHGVPDTVWRYET